MTASIVSRKPGSWRVRGQLKAIGTGVSTTAEMFELVSRGWQLME